MGASLKTRLNRSDLLMGTIITVPSPEIAEVLALAGFDWLFIDIEHSAMGIREAQAILQAVAPQVPCAVRVPDNGEVWIKKALDLGAAGVIVPRVDTAEQARLAVRYCKYPPDGVRSVGIARAHHYGRNFQPYVSAANDETAVILQIEHIDAVGHIESILAVPGIDALFAGPYDLSASMGKIGRTNDPDVQAAIRRVKASADQAGVAMGIFGANAESVQSYIEDGYALIAAGMDTLLLGKAAQDMLQVLKG